MRRSRLIVLAALSVLAACSGEAQAPPSGTAPPPSGAVTADAAQERAAPGGAPAPAAAGMAPGLAARRGELVNPDNSAMVFLYLDLAGIAPPIDDWVEKDSRVLYGPAPGKAAQRSVVKAELESGIAAVRHVGAIRLSLNGAQLSEYDPSYGEFTVGALAPSSVVDFNALGQKVALKFGNARSAQTWRVPPAEAQAIRDKIGPGGNVGLDVLLKISGVQPGPGGGTIVADVQEYELRLTRSGNMIGRVQVARP